MIFPNISSHLCKPRVKNVTMQYDYACNTYTYKHAAHRATSLLFFCYCPVYPPQVIVI